MQRRETPMFASTPVTRTILGQHRQYNDGVVFSLIQAIFAHFGSHTDTKAALSPSYGFREAFFIYSGR